MGDEGRDRSDKCRRTADERAGARLDALTVDISEPASVQVAGVGDVELILMRVIGDRGIALPVSSGGYGHGSLQHRAGRIDSRETDVLNGCEATHPRHEELSAGCRVGHGRAHRPVRPTAGRSGLERDNDVAGQGAPIVRQQLASDLSDLAEALMPRDEIAALAAIEIGTECHARRLRVPTDQEAHGDWEGVEAVPIGVEQLTLDETIALDDQVPVVERVVCDVGRITGLVEPPILNVGPVRAACAAAGTGVVARATRAANAVHERSSFIVDPLRRFSGQSSGAQGLRAFF